MIARGRAVSEGFISHKALLIGLYPTYFIIEEVFLHDFPVFLWLAAADARLTTKPPYVITRLTTICYSCKMSFQISHLRRLRVRCNYRNVPFLHMAAKLGVLTKQVALYIQNCAVFDEGSIEFELKTYRGATILAILTDLCSC